MAFLEENYCWFDCFYQLFKLEQLGEVHFGLTPQIQGGDKRSQLAAVWLICGIHCLALALV